jgi:hypothetical protein
VKWWGLTTATIALVVGLASPASAEFESVSDESGDVNVSRNGENRQSKAAPFGDIVEVSSSYRQRRLVIKARLLELIHKNAHTLYLGVDLETTDERVFLGQLMYSPDYGVTSTILLSDRHADHEPKGCREDALAGRANVRKATVTYIVPARCLGGADEVRSSITAMVAKFEGPYREWRDDGRMGYRIPSPYSTYPKSVYGPWVARG